MLSNGRYRGHRGKGPRGHGSLQALVHAKADIDKARTDNGITPAFMAAYNGHAASLQVLVHAKADIDRARTDDGTTRVRTCTCTYTCTSLFTIESPLLCSGGLQIGSGL
jgi:hypothetical protein